jgi:hypothetical protein
MSRWRRQQRKRSRRARERETVTLLEERFAAIRADIKRYVLEALARPRELARLKTSDAERAVLEALRELGPLPEQRTKVTARLADGNRSLLVDVTVEDPDPMTAEFLLAAGGRWVEPRIVQTFDYGFTFCPKDAE